MSQPNPNMTYEELQERLYKAALFSITTNNSKHYEKIAYDFTDEAIQLFATLCAEVTGKKVEVPKPKSWVDGMMDKPNSYKNNYVTIEIAKAQNRLIDAQNARLAQLTTKNTEEEKNT